jgi:F-type H+-transporting ATPase subunit b
MNTSGVGSWQALLLGAILCLALPPGAGAAESQGGGWGPWLEAGKLVNLLLVAAALVWVARKPLASFLAARSQAIQAQLAEAQKARLEAESRLAEINLRMSSLDDELRSIRAAAEKEAKEEYEKLSQAADRDADRVLERARQEIAGAARAAQLELKTHAAALAVRLAKERIPGEMTEEDHRRMFARFVSKVGEAE